MPSAWASRIDVGAPSFAVSVAGCLAGADENVGEGHFPDQIVVAEKTEKPRVTAHFIPNDGFRHPGFQRSVARNPEFDSGVPHPRLFYRGQGLEDPLFFDEPAAEKNDHGLLSPFRFPPPEGNSLQWKRDPLNRGFFRRTAQFDQTRPHMGSFGQKEIPLAKKSLIAFFSRGERGCMRHVVPIEGGHQGDFERTFQAERLHSAGTEVGVQQTGVPLLQESFRQQFPSKEPATDRLLEPGPGASGLGQRTAISRRNRELVLVDELSGDENRMESDGNEWHNGR